MIHITKRVLKLKVVRYFFTAAFATVVDVSVYYFAFHYLYRNHDINIFNLFVISAPAASLILSYTCGLVINFWISKHYVFKESDLRTHHQFFRFLMVALFVLGLNYLLMTFLIKHAHWYPTMARAFSAVSIGVISFIIHKTFSFRASAKEEVVD